MSLIQIDKNVPIPQKRHAGGRQRKYPWYELEIGDSFIFPTKIKKTSAQNVASKMGKTSQRHFAVRLMAEGIRCWRTA